MFLFDLLGIDIQPCFVVFFYEIISILYPWLQSLKVNLV